MRQVTDEQLRRWTAEVKDSWTFSWEWPNQGELILLLAAAREREAGLAALVERLREALNTIPVDLIHAIENGEAPAKIFLSVESCKLIGLALSLTPPAAAAEEEDE